MKLIRNLTRIIIGLVFVFSGFVKLIDPLGSTYKFIDYFVAMNLEFLSPIALHLAVIMCVTELIIGLMLLLNILPRLGSWGVLFFMTAFTPLTLWIAIKNPVTDCGCFGDAIIFTNWQTFSKNVVLFIFAVVVFIQRKQFKPYFSKLFQYGLNIIFLVSSIWLALYTYNNLPPLDFRPYHIGANILEGMSVPESEKNNIDIYDSKFIYEKDGVQKSFRDYELPDESWTFVDAEHTLIKRGYQPPISNFIISPAISGKMDYEQDDKPDDDTFNQLNVYEILFNFEKNGVVNTFYVDDLPDNSWEFIGLENENTLNPESIQLTYINLETGEEKIFKLHNLPAEEWVFIDAELSGIATSDILYHEGMDITDMILSDKEHFFFIIMPEVENANTRNLNKVKDLIDFCIENQYNYYCITGSTNDNIKKFIEQNDFKYNFYSADPVTLKTIVRSNPGVVLLREGTIIDKWAHKNIPDISKLNRELTGYSLSMQNSNYDKLVIWMYLLIFILFIYLMYNLNYWLEKNKFITNR